ncbi:MAG: ATP-binding protein [Candidatus Dadabacteria bacterium]|nr:MAG: ATP-binding protein [Candidatus Dadabacteria bacterium]
MTTAANGHAPSGENQIPCIFYRPIADNRQSVTENTMVEIQNQHVAPILERMARALERLAGSDCESDSIPDAPVLYWHGHPGRLRPVRHPDLPFLDDLLGLDRQRTALLQTIRAFARGAPANHVLLAGARGTGKSSLVRAVFASVQRDDPDVRLIAIAPGDLATLPDLLERLTDRPERFIVFCDDLTFSSADANYHSLKGLLEGSALAQPDNVLFVVTSNRRHLLPQTTADQAGTRVVDGELHESEAIEDKLAFADRFGLWLSFPPLNQATYLQIVEHWRSRIAPALPGGPQFLDEALRFARRRGTRSGRTARQFVLAALAADQGADDDASAAT